MVDMRVDRMQLAATKMMCCGAHLIHAPLLNKCKALPAFLEAVACLLWKDENRLSLLMMRKQSAGC